MIVVTSTRTYFFRTRRSDTFDKKTRLTMFSKTLSISYKIQTKTQDLPKELLPDALQYVNTLLDNKLKNEFDNGSTTIDGVFSVAGEKCMARPLPQHFFQSTLTCVPRPFVLFQILVRK